jgi:hypothetical protein
MLEVPNNIYLKGRVCWKSRLLEMLYKQQQIQYLKWEEQSRINDDFSDRIYDCCKFLGREIHVKIAVGS